MKSSTKVRALLPHTFSILNAAQREAELAGRTCVQIDDVLVALAVTGGPASRVLAAHGADLSALRAAVGDRDAADLKSIGIDPASIAPPHRRTLAQAWTAQRALVLDPGVEELIRSVPSERELLRALADHPSGGPAETLRRAGVDVEALLADQGWPVAPKVTGPAGVDGLLDGLRVTTSRTVRFVPVPFERLADVLAAPELVAEWIIPMPGARPVDDHVLVSMPTDDPVSTFEMRRVRCTRDEHHVEVVWQQFLGPELLEQTGSDDDRGYYLQVRATPCAGGCDLVLVRGVAGRGRFALPARWVGKAFAGITARHLAQTITEVALGHR